MTAGPPPSPDDAARAAASPGHGPERQDGAAAVEAYWALDRGTASGTGADAAALPADVLRWLAEHRLVDPAHGRVYAPERALRTLLADQSAGLRRLQDELARNVEALREVMALLAVRPPGRTGADIEFFDSREVLRRRIDELDALGHREFLAMRNVFPDAEVLRRSLDADLKMLAQDVECRLLVTPGAARGAGAAPYLAAMIDAGADVRVAAALPLYFNVYDRATTVLALGVDPLAPEQDAILRHPLVTGCFVRIFEHCWDTAQPYGRAHRRETAAGAYSPQERDVLAMLATGAKDEVIARRLGVSDRTLRRLLNQLAEKLGAESRFAAGARAAQLGLLDPGPETA
ncbi:LuxR C-terminal-related transcriptional regulator [Streptomyces tritici]|uniref:helix-turn-helix transcriptional regulator n=1 Tax=Streptomyces tritici TaxID=2054410 RepID=UPI003AEF42B4